MEEKLKTIRTTTLDIYDQNDNKFGTIDSKTMLFMPSGPHGYSADALREIAGKIDRLIKERKNAG